jgi:hypothetical protein
VRFGDHGPCELIYLPALGPWERLLDDANHVMEAEIVDREMQLGALRFSH